MHQFLKTRFGQFIAIQRQLMQNLVPSNGIQIQDYAFKIKSKWETWYQWYHLSWIQHSNVHISTWFVFKLSLYLMAWGMIQRYLWEIKAVHGNINSTPKNISTSLCPKFPVSVSGRKNAKLEWVLWMTSPPVTITSCLFGQLHYETHCTYSVVSWYISTYSRAATVVFRQKRQPYHRCCYCHRAATPTELKFIKDIRRMVKKKTSNRNAIKDGFR